MLNFLFCNQLLTTGAITTLILEGDFNHGLLRLISHLIAFHVLWLRQTRVKDNICLSNIFHFLFLDEYSKFPMVSYFLSTFVFLHNFSSVVIAARFRTRIILHSLISIFTPKYSTGL
ncbi:hypothetical protein Lalb_Chr23g0266821 [Lupinus albus]|uniref:Uncharacterized protein n=1 Tax=Lupinus albus TaxID=3870 RepID=A0A6A4NB72_LUPAL|nr:hypothetical protein Lalb_Chr23g0266821 [Lupinus albus]